MNEKELASIEEKENKYLIKYFYFLKFVENEMLLGFETKEKIKNDWQNKYKASQFAVGAERIVYALLNGKGIGQPNSNPVSSDMFFEVEDAFIHIDMKTVETNNIGDYNKSIFVEKNQNSYKGKILVNKKEEREYNPNLPTYYTINGQQKKICLTYFITILSNSTTMEVEVISIMCMPNGLLEPVYKSDVLKAGKNPGKTRFCFSKVPYFRLLGNGEEYSRVKLVYFNNNMNNKIRDKLKFYEQLYSKNIKY